MSFNHWFISNAFREYHFTELKSFQKASVLRYEITSYLFKTFKIRLRITDGSYLKVVEDIKQLVGTVSD